MIYVVDYKTMYTVQQIRGMTLAEYTSGPEES